MLKILLTKVLFTLKRKFVCYNFETKLNLIMKLPLLIGIIAICTLMASCSKDKYTTKPQLDLKSVNGNRFSTNADIQFQFIVTDKQGDIQNKLWVQKISLVCSDSTSRVPTPYAVPDFTGSKNLKVDLDVNYIYGTNEG